MIENADAFSEDANRKPKQKKMEEGKREEVVEEERAGTHSRLKQTNP